MPSVTSSLVVGGTLSPINAGNVRNVGHEFELTWKDRVGGFNYTLSGNVATLKNEVTYIYETLTRVSGGSGGSGITTYFEKGFPIWYTASWSRERPRLSAASVLSRPIRQCSSSPWLCW